LDCCCNYQYATTTNILGPQFQNRCEKLAAAKEVS
jgi:hypothetical protein